MTLTPYVPLRSLRRSVPLTALILAAALILLSLTSLRADAAEHGQVVPETPRRDVPVVLDGIVYAHAQVGNTIFVGGEFQNVARADGTVISQPHIFAYDVSTGALLENFRPVLDKRVRSLEASPDGTSVYVGGRFNTWDGAFVGKLAKLNATGALDARFTGTASAEVLSIAARNDKVFLAGDFTFLSGAERIGFGAVSATTGSVDPGFVMNVTEAVSSPNLGRTVVLTSDGNSLFGLYLGRSINNQTREAVFKADVSGATATLSSWNVDWSGQQGARECLDRLRDMAISPDDSFIVIGGQGADNPPNCDSVLNYPVAGNGTVGYNWVARMYSSVFSLAVSDSAVYAGGHFCAAPRNPIPQGEISSDWTGTANRCDVNNPFDPNNPSVLDPDNAVFRKQMAALDPDTGQALPWDPGSNNFVAVYDLTVTESGLFAGHDRDRFNDILTGRSGFFSVGNDGPVDPVDPGVDTTAPDISIAFPGNGSDLESVTGVSGSASDNVGVVDVTMQLQNVDTGLWLQPDGSFSGVAADLQPEVDTAADPTVSWSLSFAELAEGSYEILATAVDAEGNSSSTTSSFIVRIRVPFACTVTLNGADQPVIGWPEVAGVNRFTVQRDGVNQTTVRALTWTDTSVDPGTYVYSVYYKLDGVNRTVDCSPSPIIVPGDGGGPVDPGEADCVVALQGDGTVLVTWIGVDGFSSYQVWDQDGRIANVNGTSYVHQDPTPGDRIYFIRYGKGKSRSELSCSPDPIIIPQ